MAIQFIFIIIFFILLGVLLFAEEKENAKIRYVCMTLLMPLLLLYYIFGVPPNSINGLIIVAVIFGYLGDLFLMFHKEKLFIFGLGSFLFGHIFYIIAFLLSLKNIAAFPLWGLLFVLPSIAVIIKVFRKTQGKLGDIQIPIYFYMGVIFVMGFCAILRLAELNVLSFFLVWLGANLFILSDGMIALNKFDEEFPHAELYIKITYVLAQFFIVQGIVLAAL